MNPPETSPAFTAPLVELVGVQRRFRVGPEVMEVLRDVSFRLERGDLVTLSGHSGSGKSLLMKIIGLLDEPDEGAYRFEGRDITHAPDDQRTRLRNRRIGFVFQYTPFLPRLSVVENVALPLRYRGSKTPAALAQGRATLARLGLEKLGELLPHRLSGGQVQALGIARALAGAPDLLLADEPTASLDASLAARVMNLFTDLNREGVTILLATHDPAIARLGRRHLALREGRVEEMPIADVASVSA